MFDFSDILRTYIVKQYGHYGIQGYRDKTAPAVSIMQIDGIVELNKNDTAMTATVNFRQNGAIHRACDMHPNHAPPFLGALHPLVHRQRDNKTECSERYRGRRPFRYPVLRLHFGYSPLIPTDMAKRRSRQWSNNADTTRWATSSSTWWKHTSTAICPCSVTLPRTEQGRTKDL